MLPEMEIKPVEIPGNPQITYRTEGWVSWSDWMGTSNVHPKKMVWRDFKRARKFVKNLVLQTGTNGGLMSGASFRRKASYHEIYPGFLIRPIAGMAGSAGITGGNEEG